MVRGILCACIRYIVAIASVCSMLPVCGVCIVAIVTVYTTHRCHGQRVSYAPLPSSVRAPYVAAPTMARVHQPDLQGELPHARDACMDERVARRESRGARDLLGVWG